MSNGWIKLHRSLIKWEWFTEHKTSHFMIYCLLSASHNEYNWKGKKLKKGQFPFGFRKASKDTGLTISEIRTCVKRLKLTHEIAHESSPQGSVITILKWDNYQGVTEDLANESQTISKRLALTKKVNKVNKVNTYIDDEKFEILWDAFEKVGNKKTAREKITKLINNDAMYDKITKSIDRYKKYIKSNNQYSKHFTTWINQESWDDELDMPPTEAELDKMFADM